MADSFCKKVREYIHTFPLPTKNRAGIGDIIGFGVRRLLPAFVTSFLMSAVQLKHREGNKVYLGAAFQGQGSVGSHTDILVIQHERKTLFRFAWSHPGRCPFGKPLHIFCPKCRLYKPWQKPYIHPDGNRITNSCSGCGYSDVMTRPPEMSKWTKGKGLSSGPEGDWFVVATDLLPILAAHVPAH